ncbi:Uncharacterised protein [Candidatus Gugararchaeum adminiculabundum]|nr:Uncharacterised protein [Candidatus Gugararchaeum adminiculabundum]
MVEIEFELEGEGGLAGVELLKALYKYLSDEENRVNVEYFIKHKKITKWLREKKFTAIAERMQKVEGVKEAAELIGKAIESHGNSGSARTLVDDMVEFIQAKKKVTVEEICKSLFIERAQAEKVLELLEKNGFVKMRYSVINPMQSVVESKGLDLKERLQKEKDEIARKMFVDMETEIGGMSSQFLTTEREISNMIREIDAKLDDLESKEQEWADEQVEGEPVITKEHVAGVFKEITKIEGSLENLTGNAHEFEEQLDKLKKRIALLEERIAKREKSGTKLESFFESR